MKNEDLLKQTILFNCLNLQLLDFLDESIEKNNSIAVGFINDFFNEKKSFTYDEVRGTKFLSSISTSLGMLTSVIFFLRNQDINSYIIDFEYEYIENQKKVDNIGSKTLIRTIRNVIAHNQETENTSVNLCVNGFIHFEQLWKNDHRRVTFTPENFHKFIMWLIKNSRKTIR